MLNEFIDRAIIASRGDQIKEAIEDATRQAYEQGYNEAALAVTNLRERNRKLFEALDGIHEDCANKLDDDYVFALCVLKEERAHREREASDD